MNLAHLNHYVKILQAVAAGKTVKESGISSRTFAAHAAPLVASGMLARASVTSRYEITPHGKDGLATMEEIQVSQAANSEALAKLCTP